MSQNQPLENARIQGCQPDDKEAEYINLKVLGERQGAIQFKLKKRTPFLKLKEYYRNYLDVTADDLKFMHDGSIIADDDTPEKLEIEDGDEIDVFYTQTGGVLLS